MDQKDTNRLMEVIFPEKLKPETCWGCSSDYLHSWTKFDLGHITSFVTGGLDVLVCPDCREEIENIEKENTDEIIISNENK